MDKDKIIEQTISLAQKKGWKKTSVREISKEIGYSTIKVYSDFGGKEGLLKEIQKKGFQQLKDVYLASMAKGKDPVGQLAKLTIGHFKFAKDNTHLYELMFSLNGAVSSFPDPELLKDTGSPVRALLQNIDGELLKHRFYHWWSIAHGFFSITMNNPHINDQEYEKLLKQIVKDFATKK
ncbi:MAG: TetR/AcrR family transcriptional regulator [Bacteroidota bacterium]